jgi:sugar/nucleoside kinase (ribokinase family)
LTLLTVGEAFEDLIVAGLPRLPRLSEELRVPALSVHPGGGAVITAIAARRLGLRTGVITAVSDANASVLRRERVSLINLKHPGEAGAVTVALSTVRDRAFVTFEGVNRVLEPRLLAALTRQTRTPAHVHFALVPRRCRTWVAIVERLRRRGCSTSWDFGWHERLVTDPAFARLIRAVDWVFVNEREAMFYSGTRSIERAAAVWQELARGAALKLGVGGSVVVAGAQRVRSRAGRKRVIDTTGAGDAFNAGFLAAWLADGSLTNAARLGNYLGGRSVGAAGGIDGLPSRGRLPAWARRILDNS